MPSPTRSALAVLVACAALAACSGRQKPKPANVPVLAPSATLKSATFVGGDFEAATVLVSLDVTNPNPFALPVARVAHAVELGGVPAYAGETPANVAVPANGTFTVNVPVRLPYAPIPGIAEKLAAGAPIAYRVNGALGLQTPAGIVDVPVGWEGILPLPKLPTYELVGVEVGAMSAILLEFEVRLQVRNPNGFALPKGSLGHRLAVAGAPVASGNEKIPGVPPGGAVTFGVQAHVNLVGMGMGAGKAVYNAIQGQEIPVALEGQASLAGIPVDVKLESRIPKLRR